MLEFLSASKHHHLPHTAVFLLRRKNIQVVIKHPHVHLYHMQFPHLPDRKEFLLVCLKNGIGIARTLTWGSGDLKEGLAEDRAFDTATAGTPIVRPGASFC